MKKTKRKLKKQAEEITKRREDLEKSEAVMNNQRPANVNYSQKLTQLVNESNPQAKSQAMTTL